MSNGTALNFALMILWVSIIVLATAGQKMQIQELRTDVDSLQETTLELKKELQEESN